MFVYLLDINGYVLNIMFVNLKIKIGQSTYVF